MLNLIETVPELRAEDLAAGIDAPRFPLRPRESQGLGALVFVLDLAARDADDDEHEDETDDGNDAARPQRTPGRGLGGRGRER